MALREDERVRRAAGSAVVHQAEVDRVHNLETRKRRRDMQGGHGLRDVENAPAELSTTCFRGADVEAALRFEDVTHVRYRFV
jgi:hypothetical protein